jgi:hypothetical protein
MQTYELTIRYEAASDREALGVAVHIEQDGGGTLFAFFDNDVLSRATRLRIERLTKVIVTTMPPSGNLRETLEAHLNSREKE